MPYCLYLRKSRADLEAEARGEGETLARHKKILLDLAKRQKLNITAIYPEVVSGDTIAARPVMQQLLSEVEQDLWEGVLVVEVERLARGDTIDQGIVAQTFKFSNTKIITPMKTYDPNNEFDEEYFEFGLFMSRREYKTITRRLQSGRLQSVKEGKYVGNRPPYGYVRKKLESQKGYSLEIYPEQAEIVKLIFDLYAHQRLGVSLIVRKLNDLHIPPAKGDVWVTSSIQTILRNPVYTGKVRWNFRPSKKKMVDGQIHKERPRAKPENWTLAKGLHEAIIDQATFDLAQKYLAENPSHPCPKDMPVKNPLAGLIVCGVCGRKMVRRPYTKKSLQESLMCPSTACTNVGSYLSFVENRLIITLEKWLDAYKENWGSSPTEEVSENQNQHEIKKKALKKFDEELLAIVKQMDSLHDLLEQGVYSTETFLERSRILNERQIAVQDGRKALLDDLHRDELKKESRELIIPMMEKALELYRATDDPEVKNKLLNEILEKAVYKKSTRGHRGHFQPDDFELDIYPRLPQLEGY
jgi:site-specific DNA recombinase